MIKMNLAEKKLKRVSRLLIFLLVSITISLFFVNGPIWLWLIFTGWILFTCFLWIPPFKYFSKKIERKKRRIPDFLFGIIITFLFISPILISIVTFPFIMIPTSHLRAEFNQNELSDIVEDYCSNCSTDEEKVRSLLRWFERDSGNIRNIWGAPSLPPFHFIGWNVDDWIICTRTINRKPPLWVLTSRCGACEEHSVLFREMAKEADIPVRLICCHGIDHIWAEVMLDDEWVIVEPANVVDRLNKTGYNLDASSYERIHAKRTKNISYVYAEYANGTIQDVTSRYTNVSNITIKVVDDTSTPLSNVALSVKSYNRFSNGKDSRKEVFTNDEGIVSLTLGGGEVEFISQKGMFLPWHNETRFTFQDESEYALTISLQRDWNKGYTIPLISAGIAALMIDCFFFRKKPSFSKE